MDHSNARAVALEVIRRVTDHGAYSNLLLPALLGRSRLSPRDRQLATELAYGTLRRLVRLDHALGRLLERPLTDAPPAARGALRVGAYQLLFTRIPDHAAVSETVALVEPGQRGLVNAVLRRLAKEGAPPPPTGATPRSVGLRTGLATWAVEELRHVLGEEAESAAEALAEPAPLTLRTNTCRTTVDQLAAECRAAGLDPQPGSVRAETLRVPGGVPAEVPKFREGWFVVQDESSGWVVDVLDPRPGDRVLDACAGPGGKATDIACRSGAVIAADVSPRRTAMVGRVAARLGVRVLLLVQDARRPAVREGFDRILVDAPCSGIGAARRRPELLWRIGRRDVARLARLQLQILRASVSLLAPGGVLVYSVCTFSGAETDHVCDRLLEVEPELEPDPFVTPDGGSAARDRLWPHRHGTDAMFAARFRRRLRSPSYRG
jgi:16S rRNA (cytosine967-C5)-methyltransferase